MSLRLARIAALGFGAIALAAAINMLVLQSGRGLAREDRLAEADRAVSDRMRKFSLDSTMPVAPTRPAALYPSTSRSAGVLGGFVVVGQHSPTSAEIPAAPVISEPVPLTAELVKAIQRELKRKGYEPGSIDGTLGDVTRAAIMAYENDQGLLIDAKPSEALLQALRTGRTTGLPRASGEIRQGAAVDVTRQTQDSLARLGYQTGTSDGQMSDATQQAIRDFEKDHGLIPSGRISGELILRLVSAATARRTVANQPAARRR